MLDLVSFLLNRHKDCGFSHLQYVFVSFCTEKETEESQPYIKVTIDTTHKVKDHYNVHEKLGV